MNKHPQNALYCILSVVLIGASAYAAVTGTNLVEFTTVGTGTNTSKTWTPPQTYTLTPQTITLYHSATNRPGTNILQVSFDGGATWANLAISLTSTNQQTEVWLPATGSLTCTNRILTIGTNQTLYINANWTQ